MQVIVHSRMSWLSNDFTNYHLFPSGYNTIYFTVKRRTPKSPFYKRLSSKGILCLSFVQFDDYTRKGIERMQPIPKDSNDNGGVTMLVYHNKPTLLLMVHQHGGDDVTCIRSIWERIIIVFMLPSDQTKKKKNYLGYKQTLGEIGQLLGSCNV